MLKRILFVVAIAVLAIPLGLAFFSPEGKAAPVAQAQTPAPAAEPVLNPTRTITVVGQGSARVVPDVAQVTVGVETKADVVADATLENQTKMKAILAALKQLGIADKDIQTSNYSITLNRSLELSPEAQDQPAGTTPKYTVSNMVTVTIRDLTLVSDVLDAVVEAGANSVWGINFTLDKPDVALGSARTDAVADARARAEALAELGGVQLGPVMSMSEVMGGGSIPMIYAAEGKLMNDSGTSISPGEVELSYQVQVSFYIIEE